MAFEFKEDSEIVKGYILLLSHGEITMGNIPDLFNLSIMVKLAWNKYVEERDGK
ncbi:hypothetical protein [Lysinibacillus sp. NPDC086135]|uniref:hypothetical protein n=1 Tax=Lysinibacillus sp. NPDC086135 TaxID=3364130 RepID=UPI00381DA6B2